MCIAHSTKLLYFCLPSLVCGCRSQLCLSRIRRANGMSNKISLQQGSSWDGFSGQESKCAVAARMTAIMITKEKHLSHTHHYGAKAPTGSYGLLHEAGLGHWLCGRWRWDEMTWFTPWHYTFKVAFMLQWLTWTGRLSNSCRGTGSRSLLSFVLHDLADRERCTAFWEEQLLRPCNWTPLLRRIGGGLAED